MNKFQKLYDAIDSGKTILCVGPMSINCIEAAIEVANENQIPMILIPSRRQVECKKLGGGYVMNTEDFVPYVRQIDKGNFIFIERDHGGIFQGNNESNLNRDIAINNAMDSYIADVDAGFDIVELDSSLLSQKGDSLNFILFYNKLMHQFCEDIKEDENIIYEFEFEEHSEKKTDIKDFQKSIDFIKKMDNNDSIKFLVGNVGLYVREMENVGKVDFELLEKLIVSCREDGLLFKMHNCDYLDVETLQKMNKAGVAAINIAPEWAIIETKFFIECLKKEKMVNELDIFFQHCIDSNKWEKWMRNDLKIWRSKSEETEYKSLICGHYNFNNIEILNIKQKLQRRFDFNKQCKQIIKNKISFCLKNLGWF